MPHDTLIVDAAPEAANFYKERVNLGDDSGFDLFVTEAIMVPPRSQVTLDFKIVCEKLGSGGYYLYPRSSISKTPLRLANSVGIIDAGYRGSIMAKVDNISDEAYVVRPGDRLFQICMPSLESFFVKFGAVSRDTERGTGGFGSTGGGRP